MKQLLLFILTLLYITSTTGAMLETHFCMGRLADWSIGDAAGEQCGLCGMQKSAEQDNGCCSDQESFFKVTDDQKAQAGIEAPPLFPGKPPCTLAATHLHNVIEPYPNQTLVNAPPGSPGKARHVLISVFRI